GLSVVPVESDKVQAITDDLDLGERAAIALAATMHADLLLIDEAAGRAEARRRNLRVTGTLGGAPCRCGARIGRRTGADRSVQGDKLLCRRRPPDGRLRPVAPFMTRGSLAQAQLASRTGRCARRRYVSPSKSST